MFKCFYYCFSHRCYNFFKTLNRLHLFYFRMQRFKSEDVKRLNEFIPSVISRKWNPYVNYNILPIYLKKLKWKIRIKIFPSKRILNMLKFKKVQALFSFCVGSGQICPIGFQLGSYLGTDLAMEVYWSNFSATNFVLP